MTPPLLLYLSWARDPQRLAVGPALAAAAERAGWAFDCYYDDLRRGRHYGGGDPAAAPSGWAAGSLVAGGRHAEQLLCLAARFRLVALGDADCVLWPALEAAGAEVLVRSCDPAALYGAAFPRLGQEPPASALVVDGEPQGPNDLVTAPYLYPWFLADEPVAGVEVTLDQAGRDRLEDLGITAFRGKWVDSGRALAFAGGLESAEGFVGRSTYAELTAELAGVHARWGRGVLLGDPDLVAAQLPKARRLRLLPLYGQPQTQVITRAAPLITSARDPVFGRQWDDSDFFELAKLGCGLQVVDPGPPFDAASVAARPGGAPGPARAGDAQERPTGPTDAELLRWADEGRILVTLLFWSGMLRELDGMYRLLDLVATTGLRAGLVVTAETVEYASASITGLLSARPERGGVSGLVELVAASTGRGVCAEVLLPSGVLGELLADARQAMAACLPPNLQPRGWWPLLDAPLVERRPSPVSWSGGCPVVRFRARGAPAGDQRPGEAGTRADLRSLAGVAVRRCGLDRFFEEHRPFDHARPGPIDRRVAEQVRGAGFDHMWTKAHFGASTVCYRQGDFVALPFTAGNWDGWSPFWTIGSVGDVARAERRLLRTRRPGWLASTVDSPLWAMSGEVLEHGSALYRMAALVAGGGRSGRLVNVTPDVVARYARLLHERGTPAPAGEGHRDGRR